MSILSVSYAQALYDLAREEHLEDRILEELETLRSVMEDQPEFLRLLSVPNLSKAERCQIVDNTLGGRVHPYVLSFTKLLTEKGGIRSFCQCCKEFQKLYDVQHGILAVCAVTALPLTPEQTGRLTAKLETVTGKTVRIENRVDPACLGGVRLDYDGKRLDGTVQSRLASVRELLKNTVL